MPTPHGNHGMAFSAHEVRVLRRALSLALHPSTPAADGFTVEPFEFWALGRAIAEAGAERRRQRRFAVDELERYRDALPGAAAGYLRGLDELVARHGYVPTAQDLAALRVVAEQPCGGGEAVRREELLARCTALAEEALERRLAERARERTADPLDVLIPPLPVVPAVDETPPAPVRVEGLLPEESGVVAGATVAQAPAPVRADGVLTDGFGEVAGVLPVEELPVATMIPVQPVAETDDLDDDLDDDCQVGGGATVVPYARPARPLGELPSAILPTGTG